jgi:plasmid maintenance system antidote protein VapI
MDWVSQLNQLTDREETVANYEVNVPRELLPGLLVDKEPLAVTADMTLRLAWSFGAGPDVWLRLQARYGI